MKPRYVFASIVGLGILASPLAAQSTVFVKADAAPGGSGASWSQAFRDLQDAIDLANAPGNQVHEIWVAAGTYRPDRGTGSRTESFRMRAGLIVLGGFAGTESSRRDRNPAANPTILSGDLGTGFSYHIVTAYGVGSDALLDGFAIRAGKADGSGASGEGGGIRGEQTSMRFANLSFGANRAARGGAAYFFESSPLFFNCRFLGNHATADSGAIHFLSLIQSTITPAVINCTLVGNTADLRYCGAAISCITLNGSLKLRNSVLWDNSFTIPTYYPSAMFGPVDAAYSLGQESSGWPPVSHPPNTLYSDPKLVLAKGLDGIYGTSDDDARLAATSPCIDSGDSDSIPLDVFDLDDDGNMTEPWPVDAENGPRQYDDPATPDTGAGAGDNVDMGAFEGPALAVLVAPVSIQVLEGTTSPVQVSLTRSPGAPTTLTVTATGDPDLNPDSTSLSFNASNWQTPQALGIQASQDADSFNGETSLSLSAPGVVTAAIAAEEIDNDSPPGLVYVNRAATGANTGGSWGNAFTSLQTALTYAAGSGGSVHEIWVAQGTYIAPAASFVLQNGLALYGGFVGTEINRAQRDWDAHPTILSGDTLSNDGANFTNYLDNRIHVLTASNTDATAQLDGFVVQAGYAFSQDTNGSFGAGLFCEPGRPTIANTTFRANWSRVKGGAVYCSYNLDGGPSFLNCRFLNNRSDGGSGTGRGGGISAEPRFNNGGPLLFRDCLFQANRAQIAGGGAEIGGSAVSIIDCTFDGNILLGSSATGAGLRLNVDTNGTATVQGSVFKAHNIESGNGIGAGAFMSGTGTVAISMCTFSDNTAHSSTGLAIAGQSLQGVLEDCTFSGNHASVGIGGAFLPTNLIKRRCTFSGNSTLQEGGALSSSGGLVEDCNFIGNSAGKKGGAVSSGSTTFKNCTFQGNTAAGIGQGPSSGTHVGGGAVANSGTGGRNTFIDCSFTGNRATGVFGEGGAVLGYPGVTLIRCQFSDNESHWRGGAVTGFQNFGDPVTILNCSFTGNHADESGGALSGHGALTNCSFTGNTANVSGGAIYAEWGDGLVMTQCSAAANYAPLCGGVYTFNRLVTSRNSILWGNTHSGPPGQGAQASADAAGSLAFSYSCVDGWTGSLGGPGNTGANPMFFDPDGPDNIMGTSDDSLALASGSSCIDAGRNSDVPPDALDLDSDGNLTEPTPFDLQAGPRFVDDPQTPDTGSGAAPLVDIGALEYIRQEQVFAPCYANCDHSVAMPVLNINDFLCFLNKYAAGDPYANCDASTVIPVLNVNDFGCFLNKYATGCP